MTIRFNYVMKLLAQNTLRLSVITLGSMLTSLLLTLSILFFFDHDLSAISVWIALAAPACIAPVATFMLLHYTHQLELAQRSKLEHLAKLASIGELASSIVHEINQPLAAIKLIAEGIRRKSNKDPQEVLDKLPEKIDRIIRQINRATDISAHIRQSARIATEENLDAALGPILEESISLFMPLFNEAGIIATLQLEPNLPPATIHPGRIEQVILNLFSNARDAFENNTTSDKWIKVALNRGEDQQLVIAVDDSAGGIPDHALDNIFNPFFTTKTIGKGTGLGLSVAHNLIDDVGGNISVRNTEHGARFVIRLPAVQSAPVY